VTGWKDKSKVMQRYDLTAEMYDERYAQEQKAKYRIALKNIKIAGGAVLDVGCGSGLLFSSVADQTDIVVGVDISLKLLLRAKEQARAFQNVFILQADADHLPFNEAFFVAIFAFTVLQNMPKPFDTLNELKRVAKLDGRIVVTGLKKAFSLNKFMNVLETTRLKMVSFVDDEDLKCYVAVLAT
jgi:ubiquinone/menaquinone biosynthesis C-methylase UbiE